MLYRELGRFDKCPICGRVFELGEVEKCLDYLIHMVEHLLEVRPDGRGR